jgi:hypothetical protein
MKKKGLIVLGVFLLVGTFQSCKSKPESGLLKRYFNAIRLNDVTTMSTMALEPVGIDAASWKITAVTVEKIEPATLPGLNKNEVEMKKILDGHVGPTLAASDELDVAKDELSSALTGAAKAAAKRKLDEAQAKYDQERALHNEMQKNVNEAKAASTREEEITKFSLGQRELANVRELTGNVHSKEVDVQVKTKAGDTKNYRFYLRQYMLKDEVNNVNHRGRWVIVKFEQL